jgi:hypothetical protein
MAARQFKNTDTAPWYPGFGNGSAGAVAIDTSTDATPNTTASVASGATALTAGSGTGFAAGNLILIHQSRNGGASAGAWELNYIASVGAGTNWTLGYPTVQAYDTTAQVYLLKQYSSVTINSGQTLTGASWGGTVGGIVAFLCAGTITVTGNIVVNGGAGASNTNAFSSVAGSTVGGYRGGNGGWQNSITVFSGEGTSGASAQQTTANGNGGGGAATSGSRDGGGGGGHAAAGTAGSKPAGGTVGAGGGTAGVAALTTMVFGGGGGAGAKDVTGDTNGAGGAGGGIVLLIGRTVTITGSVTVNGGAGGAANVGGAGGGGGAGGSVLIKARTGTLGTNLITSAAGAGGAGSDAAGGAGAVGRIHIDYGISFTGSTTPTIDSAQDSTLLEGSSMFQVL